MVGQLKIVQCLVNELDADVNITTFRGQTPLMAAAQINSQAIIKHLVHKGAHVRAISTHGTAITLLGCARATAAQIAYLEVRECCDGGGRKRC
jgi:ankyrin repeat protein